MATRSLPRDAQINQAILRDMGVTDYEPRLVNQMLEFTYRYVADILDDARLYSQHANKKNIDTEDVKLAVQCKLDHSFTNPPPRDLLLDIARHKNSTPLPPIKPFTGPRLPPDRYCLTTPNFRLRLPSKKPPVKTGSIPSSKFAIGQSFGTKPLISMGGLVPAIGSKPPTTPVITVKPAGSTVLKPAGSAARPVFRINAGPSVLPSTPSFVASGGSGAMAPPSSAPLASDSSGSSLKRKRDDDDDSQHNYDL